jgi:serine/threonine-protein kinase
MPPRVLPPLTQTPAPPDWRPLLAAAGLDAANLKPTEPLRTWLSTSDQRVAWTGTWPGSGWPLRVEAASLRGKPVAFALLGPWDGPQDAGSGLAEGKRAGVAIAIYGLLAVAICGVSAWLAWQNLSTGRGDRRGAFRLGAFAFLVHMALWLTVSHLVAASVLGIFLLALCTSVFYGVVLWTVYLAFEPAVRRQWPRALISWTRLLSGQWRDPAVGRDVLWGAALGVAWTLTGRGADVAAGGFEQPAPTWTDEALLGGTREALGEWLARGPHSVRDALLFFFLLFVLRLALRRQWLAAVAFVVALTLPLSLRGESAWVSVAAGVVIYGLAAIVMLRFGLLALVAAFSVAGFLGPPLSLHTDAWYFGNVLMLSGSALALTAWAFSAACRRPAWRP